MHRSFLAKTAQLLLRAGAVVFLLSGSACTSRPDYACSANAQCVSNVGAQGVCLPTGFCAYADADCGAHGLRYSTEAGQLSGSCVAATAPTACITQISAGIGFTCAVKSDGSVWCWGAAAVGQLGDGQSSADPHEHATQVALPAGVHASYVGCGEENSCALTQEGSVWCWGANDELELGQGEDDDAMHPTPVEVQFPAASLPIKSLSVGAAHTCAVDNNSAVWCWGENDHEAAGQDVGHACPSGAVPAGSDRCEDVPEPTLISTSGFTALFTVMGDEFSCAVDDLNEAHCWGDNSLGELGIGALTVPGQNVSTTPVPQKAGMGSFLTLDTNGENPSLALGAEHACAAAGGSVYCWGSNGSGQVGIGVKSSAEPTPKNVITARHVVGGSMAKHTCVVDAKGGELTCWGNNADGEIGLGTTDEVLKPTMVPIAGVQMAALGETHTCALVTGGTLYCWGANESGQLGIAAGAAVLSPEPSGVVAEICR